ncbi:hypothetical protein [Methylobacterium oryzae]|uniref:hypothetical protein n=1 Tax=Methylobacterium oryzae TaxID=334852 RepID=UPI001F3E2AC9|nr:hypothetical protein [Methylobacterium oryzae]UIN38373.1 hypothetical protein LXM90_30795 [Methylobacterium oryzae]
MKRALTALALIALAGPVQAQTNFRHQPQPDHFDKLKAIAVMFGDTQYADKACPGLRVDGDAVTKTLYANGIEMMDLEPEGPEEIWLGQQKRRGKQGARTACEEILEAYGPAGSRFPGLVSPKR